WHSLTRRCRRRCELDTPVGITKIKGILEATYTSRQNVGAAGGCRYRTGGGDYIGRVGVKSARAACAANHRARPGKMPVEMQSGCKAS
ncbi:hypothetical protein HAX54_013611, partial [Datura stramonium]|nr:hypothetical protein [Datura stramonium]